MKYCQHCGYEIMDGYTICPKCGYSVTNNSSDIVVVSETNIYAIIGFILLFFNPLLGFIFGAIGLSKSKELNGKGGGLSIVTLIFSVIYFLATIIILIIVSKYWAK